jgi:myosin-5
MGLKKRPSRKGLSIHRLSACLHAALGGACVGFLWHLCSHIVKKLFHSCACTALLRPTRGRMSNPSYLDGVGDMSELIHLDAPSVLHNMQFRYAKDQIYTSISKILIAVNPYKSLDMYGGHVISKYRKNAEETINRKINKSPLPPHVFSVSQVSHMNLLRTNMNQSMIVCGESGSGKTESAKHLLRYLAYTPSSSSLGEGKKLQDRVLDANPILESFGNAKTMLNDNSSRFGKFTKILYGKEKKHIVGTMIETYLLEKSRVVQHDRGERSYHIFYMLTCDGALSESRRKRLRLSSSSDFNYISQSSRMQVAGWPDKSRLRELESSMTSLGMDQTFIDWVFATVSAVLHLGNIDFTDDADNCNVETSKVAEVQIVANLLNVPFELLLQRLTKSVIRMRGQDIIKDLSQEQARNNRDSIAKAIYDGLFAFLVSNINQTLYPTNARQPDLNWLGILDVFGFECFENNSFEQFCINFANERLQQFFNVQLLESEQEEYLAQSIAWDVIYIASSADVIELIEGRPQGVLAVLDSACKMPRADDHTFTNDLFTLQGGHSRLKRVGQKARKEGQRGLNRMNGFSIRHYAGVVTYDAKDFMAKNNDKASDATISLLSGSASQLTQKLLVQPTAVVGAGGKSKAQSFTVGSIFSRQLGHLIDNLNETTPFFIRCIKPNTAKRAGEFDNKYVLPQLKNGGILEALRILKLGYPSRCSYDKIWER